MYKTLAFFCAVKLQLYDLKIQSSSIRELRSRTDTPSTDAPGVVMEPERVLNAATPDTNCDAA